MLKYILIYGFSFLGFVVCIQFLNYSHWSYLIDNSIYSSLLSLLFLVVGILLAKKYFTKEILIEKEVLVKEPIQLNFDEALKLSISKRELEVLALVSQGFSNQEIADQLFISLNTVKSHISNVFIKLDVSKRTKAIAKAKELGLIS